ncbi:MAG: type VI secretion system baseplate subunit TssE [Acidobacteriota bacterium]|jgi:type VI secretion system protein ImpF|nr:type VI secretion system baseplate subunit TssE [Acidobacteriota bacterium]
MPRPDPDLAVTASILDRLIDLNPDVSADPPANRSQSVRQLKAALRRDLEWLLNTRRNPDEVPEAYEELFRSLYNYGLPDVTSMALNSPRDRQRLLRLIEQTIDIFEPRLAATRVRAVENSGSGPRILRFQIEALLKMDPAPEQILFDTVLQLNSGEYQIKGD